MMDLPLDKELIVAQPKRKAHELADRYNNVTLQQNIFQLRRLRDDAKAAFLQTGDPIAGIVQGCCEIDLGRLGEAESLFKGMISRIPLDPHDQISRTLYGFYARLLALSDRIDQAVVILDQILISVSAFTERNLSWIMDVYAEAGNFEKIAWIQESFDKLYPNEDRAVLSPAVMTCYLRSGQQEAFIQSFFDYAEALDFSDANLDTLDAIIEKIAAYQRIPGSKPDLSDSEFDRLNEIKQAVHDYLVEEEAWEESLAPEVLRRANDPDDTIITQEELIKSLGLENIV